MRLFSDFEGGLRVVIGNDLKTKLWKDKWCGEQSLLREFPLVFSLVLDLDALFQDYLNTNLNPLAWHPILQKPALDWEMAKLKFDEECNVIGTYKLNKSLRQLYNQPYFMYPNVGQPKKQHIHRMSVTEMNVEMDEWQDKK